MAKYDDSTGPSGPKDLSRRGFIALASATMAALPAQPDDSSAMRALYRQWREAKAAFSALVLDADQETSDAAYWRIVGLERAAADFVPETLDDALIKIVIADDDGAMDATVFQTALASQAYAMTKVVVTA